MSKKTPFKTIITIFGTTFISIIIGWCVWVTNQGFLINTVIAQDTLKTESTNRELDLINSKLSSLSRKQDDISKNMALNHNEVIEIICNILDVKEKINKSLLIKKNNVTKKNNITNNIDPNNVDINETYFISNYNKDTKWKIQ